ncbi:MAG: response regulator [candidate division Zixibacteria bacterium]|nr:response regulator [candidate division Zixibacteria bacterium]
MSQSEKPTILLVDDEIGILKSLQRLLKELDVTVLTASGGPEALVFMKNSPITLIISDQRMPQMTGVELLSRSRAIHPNAIRILLTGYADLDSTMQAINSGAIRYYITKPWEDELLLSRIKESLELYDMLMDNKRLDEITHVQNEELRRLNATLEERVEKQTAEIKNQNEELLRSFMETIKAFSTILELRLKDVGSHSQRVSSLVKKMLQKMDLNKKEYQDIIVAAHLHDIGKVSYPDTLLKKTANTYTKTEMKTVLKHPILGQSCVIAINGFEEIALIVRHHHEHFDGSGYPDYLRGSGIPLGARLIRIADAYDHIAFAHGYPDEKRLNDAAAYLVRESGIIFDPALVRQFTDPDTGGQYYHKESAETVLVTIGELKNNMVVAENIYTDSGMFVLPRDARLSMEMITCIIKIARYDPISKGITVYRADAAEKSENESLQSAIG